MSSMRNYSTLRGFELELSGWRSRFAPWEYMIVVQSGLQQDVKIGTFVRTNVDRNMPLRDQIFINPSSPAAIDIAFFELSQS